MTWREISGDQNLRMAAKMLDQQSEINKLRATLDEVLRTFTERGHPGTPCLRSGWVEEKRVAEWRQSLLASPKNEE